jgi:drug/metabolite transporter (DMT)-like permease
LVQTLPFLALLLSALLHASWNAIARSRPEPGDALAAGVIMSGIIAVPLMAWLGLPAPASWPPLAIGIVLNTIGIRLAMAAYRHASFGLAYPVMRAGIPLFMLPVGIVFFAERPGLPAFAGVLAISLALLLLAIAASRAGRAEMRGVFFALAAGAMGAGYVASDAFGVRASGNALGYAAAVSVGNALMLAAFMAAERRSAVTLIARRWRTGLAICSLSMTSFMLYVWALVETPVALAAALRETSVLIAVAIAAVILKERVVPLQWLAVALAFAGAAGIRLG